MTRYLLLILSTLFIATSFARSPSLVVEVFRHGARGPIDLKRDSSWKDEVGQLTAVGIRQHYLLGKALLDKYPFLKKQYDAGKILIRSTDYNRTIMSAFSQLAGIYEKTGPKLSGDDVSKLAIPQFNSSLVEQRRAGMSNWEALPNNFQALPLHVRGYNEKDYALRSIDSCANARGWGNANVEDKETKDLKAELSGLFKFLQEAKVDYKETNDLVSIGDTMISNRFEGKKLYGDMKPDDDNYKALKFIYEWIFFKKYTEGYDQRALLSVHLLNEIKGYMNNTANKKSDVEFVFLSAHDSTLVPILALFNITNKTCLYENYKAKEQKDIKYKYCKFPVFASNIIFEFYEQTPTEEAYVIFSYNGDAIDICGAGKTDSRCDYKDFLKYIDAATNNHTVATFMDKCGLNPLPARSNPMDVLVGILGCVAVLLLIGLIITCASLGAKGGKRQNNEKVISLVNNDL